MPDELEKMACQPLTVQAEDFNGQAMLPYGLTVEHVGLAMSGFTQFLGFMNNELFRNGIERLESMMMPANFSTLVSEFMCSNIPRYCTSLAKNQYHNGHPDLIPANRFPNDSVQYVHEGIEIKSSRYRSGWQGHNPEDIWLMVFVYDSNRPRDIGTNTQPRPFRFLGVYGALLSKSDWTFSGRSEGSRRTITAGVNASGYQKMSQNWVYKAPEINPEAVISVASAELSAQDLPIGE